MNVFYVQPPLVSSDGNNQSGTPHPTVSTAFVDDESRFRLFIIMCSRQYQTL